MRTDGLKAALRVLSFLLGALACAPRAAADESLESLAARDPLSGLAFGSFLGPEGKGIVIKRPDAVEVVLPGPEPSAAMNVFFVSVGQGDAEYIELPNGQNVLIDGGPNGASAAAPPVAAFLEGRGVRRIDHVVLTHPHADHFAGLNYVFDNMEVGRFYDTRMDNSGASGDETVRAKAAAEPGCATSYPREGERLDWAPGVDVRVLNSCPDPRRSADVAMDAGSAINNCSITLKVSYKGASILFTGDIENEAEARLVAAYGKDLRSDVLKVGHHGSPHSSSAAFMEAVRPSLAYIEVGKNSYGHPSPAALARIEAVGSAVHRTDRNGTEEYALKPAAPEPGDVAVNGR